MGRMKAFLGTFSVCTMAAGLFVAADIFAQDLRAPLYEGSSARLIKPDSDDSRENNSCEQSLRAAILKRLKIKLPLFRL